MASGPKVIVVYVLQTFFDLVNGVSLFSHVICT